MDAKDTVIKLAQKCLEATPVIVLGSGASMPYGVGGMGELKKHLLANIKAGTAEQVIWETFTSELAITNDLEAALQKVTLPAALLDSVVRETRAMVLRDEHALVNQILAGARTLALTRLYKHLFNSTNRTLSVVTTNYDRLSEYAADAARISHYTGFSGSYFKYFDSGAKDPRTSRRPRTAEVWKVHGSLDWFKDTDGVVVALPCEVSYAERLTPLLVTPGVTKYAETHQEPFRSIIQNADAALVSAQSYLCVGYGFRDEHVQPKLIERARRNGVPIVILARTLTSSARNFVSHCSHAGFLALERRDSGTRAYFQDQPNGVDLPACSLWELDKFLDATTGVT